MSDPTQIPDRRPVLFGLLVVLVLLAATALFWPSADPGDSDTLVLTPESLRVATDSSPTGNPATTEAEPVEEGDLATDPLPRGETEIVDAIPETSPGDQGEAMRVEGTRADPGTQSRTPRPQALPPSAIPRPETGVDLQPAADGDYVLNLGFFGDRSNADRLAKDLQAKGVPAHVNPATSNGRNGYRVRVGYFQTSGEAASFGRQLKKDHGLDAWTSRR